VGYAGRQTPIPKTISMVFKKSLQKTKTERITPPQTFIPLPFSFFPFLAYLEKPISWKVNDRKRTQTKAGAQQGIFESETEPHGY
jgi:hypothetical protein